MSLDVKALRSSFELVVMRAPDLAHRFYDVLFHRYPQVRPLFSRRSRDAQERMLTEALVAVMDHLEDAPWLSDTLGGLGTKHRDYGVTAEMYGWVGECLLVTLAQVSGDEWNADLERAWSGAYSAIAGLMQGTAASAG